MEGLNDNPNFQLFRNDDGYYEMILDPDQNQTTQRISGRLLRNGNPVWETLWSGPSPKKVEFSSNLYWWLLEGSTVANITYTYLNSLGELVYVNLPPLVNWEDVLVPTINESSYTDSETGVFNTVIAPINQMIGDTIKVKVEFKHSITSKEEGSSFFETIGTRVFKDSVYIVLK